MARALGCAYERPIHLLTLQERPRFAARNLRDSEVELLGSGENKLPTHPSESKAVLADRLLYGHWTCGTAIAERASPVISVFE